MNGAPSFRLTLRDGSTRNDEDGPWSSISDYKLVGYFGKQKEILACRFPVKQIHVEHDGLEVDLEVPEGAEVYTALRSSSSVYPNGQSHSEVLGRVVGIVVNGNVVEERFLSGIGQEILGMRV